LDLVCVIRSAPSAFLSNGSSLACRFLSGNFS
jgi:hypothetical protein